jgi:arsenate reductase
MKRILIVCTGNSCRSILAEAIFNELGKGRILAFSAGSKPAGHVHPGALATLERNGMKTDGYSSKSWANFASENLDVILTVCDSAAGEACPLFRGSYARGHWGLPDPAKHVGSEEEVKQIFDFVFSSLRRRAEKLLQLPIEDMNREQIQAAIEAIADEEKLKL